MSNHKPPPLVEAILEIRWGTITKLNTSTTQIDVDQDEIALLAGQFKSHVASDFPVYSKVNEPLPHNMAHVVKHQFWTAENTWPCIQLGLGIMTINQGTASGYSWKEFKATCMQALKFLEQSSLKSLNEMSPVSIELRYQDAFLFAEGEKDSDFVKNRAQITFDLPPGFTNTELLEPVTENHHIAFSIPVVKPRAVLVNQLIRGQINGEDGFIQSTIIRADDALCPSFDIDNLENWIEEAHIVQRHTYDTLILPTHERTA